MSARVRAVTFSNREGRSLVGILHEPVAPRRDIAVVLLSAGIKGRVGPHRLYRRMATALTELGIGVLRFDFYGLGDSGGTLEEPLLADVYGSVSLGRYANDTHVAVDWACEQLGVERIVLGGLCGGAITGLLAGADNPRVAGLVALGLPITVDGSNVDKVRFMSAGQLDDIRGKYIRKLINPRAWLRVLTLQTDFRLLIRAISVRRRRGPGTGPPVPVSALPSAAPDNMNPYFSRALLGMIEANRPILLLFSESDRLYSEFCEKFVEARAFPLEKYAHGLDVKIIKNANHVLTFREWQDDMLSQVDSWLAAKFPSRGEPRKAGRTGLAVAAAAR